MFPHRIRKVHSNRGCFAMVAKSDEGIERRGTGREMAHFEVFERVPRGVCVVQRCDEVSRRLPTAASVASSPLSVLP